MLASINIFHIQASRASCCFVYNLGFWLMADGIMMTMMVWLNIHGNDHPFTHLTNSSYSLDTAKGKE
jgi:hypothetical protein